MIAATAITGRPLRAAALLGLMLGIGFMMRLPVLQRDFAAITASLAAAGNPPMAPAAVVIAAATPLSRFVPLTTPPTPVPRRKQPRQHPPMLRHRVAIAPPSPQIAAAEPLADAPQSPIPVPPDYAAQAYASLAAGDRRTAARLFDQALDAGPDPRRSQWQSDRDSLTRRWSAQAYVLVRKAGITPNPVASPVLGGGQAGANLAWRIDPLARRPVAIIARLNAALDPARGFDSATTQAAIGLSWTPTRNVTLAAERLVAIGDTALDRFSLRAAAGTYGNHGRAEYSGYGEATILDNGDLFAGAQARAGIRLSRGKHSLSPGAGAWTSIQHDVRTSTRLDVGPSLVARTPIGRINLEIAADYRFRIAGNAAPGSGPTLTISTGF